MEDRVRASLNVQGVNVQGVLAPDARVGEIAVEAARLAADMTGHLSRLSYYDGPAHFAALLMSKKSHG